MLPLVLLLALAQTGKTMPPGVAFAPDRGCQPDWLASISSGLAINSVCAPFFTFAPSSGVGLQAIRPLCSLIDSSEKTGSWWCMNGDGSALVGGAPFTNVGTPVYISAPVCPNGSDCTSVTGLRGDTANYRRANVGNISTKQTICAHMRVAGTAATAVTSHNQADGTASGLGIVIGSSGASIDASHQCGSSTFSITSTAVPGSVRFVCVVNDSGTIRSYLDGVAGPTAAAVNCTLSSPAYVGNGTGGASQVFGAFSVGVALSSARIASLARSVLADAPTGTKGEPLLLTRSSAATVMASGPKSTGIANGDVMVVPSGRPRIQSGALFVEATRTNSFQRSQEFNNAAWTLYTDGLAGVPVVTPDQAVAPDLSVTADRIDFPATGVGQSSLIYQGVCTVGQNCAITWFVKGVSGSGTLDLCAGTIGAACAPCSFDSTSYTRCERTGITNSVSSAYLGNATFYNGGTARPAVSVYVWGAQAENASSYATSYIPTTNASAARTGDLAQFDLGVSAPAASMISAAVTKSGYPDSLAGAYSGYFALSPIAFADPSGRGLWMYNAATSQERCLFGNDAGSLFSTATTAASSSISPIRSSCWSNGAGYGMYGSTSLAATPAFSGTFAASRYLNIGNTGGNTAYIRDGLYSNMCVDRMRCR